MLQRGTNFIEWTAKPDGDKTWNNDDYARAATYEMRWRALGVCEPERLRLIPCAVQIAKHPGTVYNEEIMNRLATLVCNA
jgi:hypothetical protein